MIVEKGFIIAHLQYLKFILPCYFFELFVHVVSVLLFFIHDHREPSLVNS